MITKVRRFIPYFVALSAILFATGHLLFDNTTFLVILNSIFIGSIVAVTITYYKLLWDTLYNFKEYTRARHFALGVFLAWLAIVVLVCNSIIVRSTNLSDDIPVSYLGTIGRYLAIVAAWIQITAPDLVIGTVDAEDKKTLTLGIVVGAILMLITLFLQRASL